MVGVPGRSKACGTCRIRKKGGCDMQRPTCGQCRQTGLKCEGYRRERIFVQVVYGRPPEPAQVSSKKAHQTQTDHEIYLPPEPSPLIRSANEERCTAIFWDNYLPSGKSLPMRLARYTTGGWTNALHQQIRKTPSMRRVLLALALSTAGRVQGELWMHYQGLECYVASLTDACSSLRTQSEAVITQCVTARLSALYETTNGIQCRKRNILCTPEWKTRPWIEIAKTPFDLLMDIFVEMPCLLEDLDNVLCCSPAQLEDIRRHDLIGKCRNLDKQLTNWRISIGLPSSFEHVSTPADVERCFSVDLLVAVHIMCIYWSTCIIVHSTWQILATPLHGTLLEADTPSDPRAHCRRIAEALPVLFSPAAGEYGTQNTMFPVASAMMYLNAFDEVDAPSEEKRMIIQVFEESRNAHLIDEFRDSMQRQDARTSDLAMREGRGAARARARSWFGID